MSPDTDKARGWEAVTSTTLLSLIEIIADCDYDSLPCLMSVQFKNRPYYLVPQKNGLVSSTNIGFDFYKYRRKKKKYTTNAL